MALYDLTGHTYGEESEHWFSMIKHLRERMKSLQYNAYVSSLITVQEFRVEQQNAKIFDILKDHLLHSGTKKRSELSNFYKLVDSHPEILGLIRNCSSGDAMRKSFLSIRDAIRASFKKNKEKEKGERDDIIQYTVTSLLLLFLESFNSDFENEDNELKEESRRWIQELTKFRVDFNCVFCKDAERKEKLKTIIDTVQKICEDITDGNIKEHVQETGKRTLHCTVYDATIKGISQLLINCRQNTWIRLKNSIR